MIRQLTRPHRRAPTAEPDDAAEPEDAHGTAGAQDATDTPTPADAEDAADTAEAAGTRDADASDDAADAILSPEDEAELQQELAAVEASWAEARPNRRHGPDSR